MKIGLVAAAAAFVVCGHAYAADDEVCSFYQDVGTVEWKAMCYPRGTPNPCGSFAKGSPIEVACRRTPGAYYAPAQKAAKHPVAKQRKLTPLESCVKSVQHTFAGDGEREAWCRDQMYGG